MSRVLFVDNYDSFTYNVVHLLASAGASPDVVLNDDPRLEPARARRRTTRWSWARGPGRPEHAPQTHGGACGRRSPAGCRCSASASACRRSVQVLGASVTHAPRQMHGKTSAIEHDGSGVFAGLPSPLRATRYHSLCLDPATIPRSCASPRAATTASCKASRTRKAGARRAVPSRIGLERARQDADREFFALPSVVILSVVAG